MKEKDLFVPWENRFYDPDLFDAAAGDSYSDGTEEMYYNLIGKAPKKIAEFGCGTGRVILKLAHRGHTVIGIDRSKEMLSSLRKKIRQLKPEIKNRVKVIHADIGKTEKYHEVNMALAVDDFVTHFLSEGELKAFFLQVALWVNPGDLFITDLRPRDPEKISNAKKEYPKPVFTYGMVHHVKTLKGIRSVAMKYWEDYNDGVLISQQNFDFITPDGLVEKTVYKTLRQRLYTKNELIAIASSAGFELARFITMAGKNDESAGVYVFQRSDKSLLK